MIIQTIQWHKVFMIINLGVKTMEKDEIKIHISSTFHDYLYSGDVKFLYFLCLLMLLDIITGIARAYKFGNLLSKKSMFGFVKKILIFCIIILANVIDQLLNLKGGLLIITILYYIANEGLSIVENCAEMDILIPKQIQEKLSIIKNESSDKNDNDQSRKD